MGPNGCHSSSSRLHLWFCSEPGIMEIDWSTSQPLQGAFSASCKLYPSGTHMGGTGSVDDTRARWLSIPARADGVGGRAMTERLPDPQVRERERTHAGLTASSSLCRPGLSVPICKMEVALRLGQDGLGHGTHSGGHWVSFLLSLLLWW